MISMLTGRSRRSVHKAVRSDVASATLWSAEIRGIDGSVAVPPSPTLLLPQSGTAVGGGATRAEAQSVLGLLGDVVHVSGASLKLGPSVAPSPAPDGHPWSITLGTVAVVAASFLQLVASPSPLLSTVGFPFETPLATVGQKLGRC